MWDWMAELGLDCRPQFWVLSTKDLPSSFCAQIFKKFCLSIPALCILQSVSLSAQHAPISLMEEEFMSDVLSGSAAPALNWTQDFSALALLTSWVAEFFVVAGWRGGSCPVHGKIFSSIPGFCLPVASSTCSLSWNNLKRSPDIAKCSQEERGVQNCA